MKKSICFMFVFLFMCVGTLTGCDPMYPSGNIKVANVQTLTTGVSVEIEIVYPNTGGSRVRGWKDQMAEIINRDEIVALSGLSVAGLKPGTALIKISATTVLSDEGLGWEERIYSTEIEIKVE